MISKIPGRKIGMTSAFDSAGTTVPVTIIQPCKLVITEIKRPERHGYAAIQVAFEETLPKRINKPRKGILAKAGVTDALARMYELRLNADELAAYTLGQEISPSLFLKTWDTVTVTGTSKGKGFAGAVKRWGFSGQCRTHGDPDNRRPQSNNATDPARVFRGSRRPGRMGHDTVTVKGLSVFEYDRTDNLLAVNGSVPGPVGGLVFVTVTQTRVPDEEES